MIKKIATNLGYFFTGLGCLFIVMVIAAGGIWLVEAAQKAIPEFFSAAITIVCIILFFPLIWKLGKIILE